MRASNPASPEINPSGKVLAPGDIEDITRKERLANGVPVPEAVWDSIKATAAEVGVKVPEI